MLNATNFYGFDNDNFILSPWKREEERRQRRAALERRRLRQQEMERQNEIRQHRAAYEDAMGRHARQQHLVNGSRSYESPNGRNSWQGSSYDIVQGADGRLYRVPRGRALPTQDSSKKTTSKIVRGPDGRLYRLVHEDDSTSDSESESQENIRNAEPKDTAENRVEESESDGTKTTSNDNTKTINDSKGASVTMPSLKRRVPFVLVEDASESEYEDERSLDKILRNRLPSPGQWIEPVEMLL